MSTFPVTVDLAIVALALETAHKSHRSIQVILGDEDDPMGITDLHPSVIEGSFQITRSAIRATDSATEALVKRWIEPPREPGNMPAIVFRSSGETALVWGHWETED